MNSAIPHNREKEIFEQALLQDHETDAGFLPDEPEGGTTVVSVSEKLGDWIGRYRLMEKIGEGGCGLVNVAEQQEPENGSQIGPSRQRGGLGLVPMVSFD